MKSALITLCMSALVLCGCATPYAKYGYWNDGGYTDRRIQDNIFKVTFEGNQYSKRDEVVDFALLRATEVAMENGYNYFVITEGDVWKDNLTFSTPATSYTTGNVYTSGTVNTYGNTGTYSGGGNLTSQTTTYGGQTYNISWPMVSYTIACFIDTPEDVNATVYVAKQVSDNLRATYKIKPKIPQRGNVPENLIGQSDESKASVPTTNFSSQSASM